MATARSDMADLATARANVYGMLADVFRAEPSEAFLYHLKGPEMSGALKALGVSLEDMLGDSSPDRLAEDLAVEYAKLFIGPGPRLSPHESLHVDSGCGGNDFWGEETVQVKKFMEAAGVAVDESFTGMPDHISAELEFMQMLAVQEASYWAKGKEGSARSIKRVQQRFFDDHLSQWIPGFCHKVIEQAELPYFKTMAELTKDFIDLERTSLGGQDIAAQGA
jgi:TorA maturation chaperone TorD